MKINKIDWEKVLDLEEFIKKYKNKLDKEAISQSILDNMAASILYCYEWKQENYIDCIERIYISILEIENIDYPNGNIESFYKLIKNINSISSDLDFNKYNKKELCKKAYNNLLADGIDGKYMKEKMPEEFKSKHLTDIIYHVNCIKKHKISKELRDEINRNAWRYMI